MMVAARKEIIIDTNAFLALSHFGLDIFTALDDACDFAYDLFVFEGTVAELEKLIVREKGKEKAAAKLGLQVLRRKVLDGKLVLLDDIDSKLSVDDNLVLASCDGKLVLTQDKELKGRLSRPYLTIRQKKKVILLQ